MYVSVINGNSVADAGGLSLCIHVDFTLVKHELYVIFFFLQVFTSVNKHHDVKYKI